MTVSTIGPAVRWHAAGDLRLDAVPIRDPSVGEVLVEVSFCGVCGSDLHEILDGPHAIPIDRPHPLSGATAPIVLGHEFSGTIAAVGDGVEGVGVGDAVVIEPNYRCGVCAQCRADRYHTCVSFGFAGLMGNGGMARYVVVPEYMIHRLPVGFDLAQAAVLEPAAVALHAVRRSAVRAGDTAVVIGLGAVGLLVGALLRIKGASLVTGIDPVAERRTAAMSLGFSDAVGPDRIGEAAVGVDVAFEAVGAQSAFDTAIDLVRPGGEVMLLGLADELSLRAFDFVNAEKTIRASVGYNNCHEELIGLVATGALTLSGLISRVVSLDDAPEELVAMANSRAAGIKTLIAVKDRNHE